MTQIFSAAVDWAATRRPSSRAAKLTALALILGAGILGVTTQVIQSSQAATRHQTGPFIAKWQPGYYVSNGWLCYGWSNGAYHCTAWWHLDSSGHYVSDNPSWVPNVGQPSGGATAGKSGGQAGGAPQAYTVSGTAQAFATAGEPCKSGDMWVSNISQWAVPPSCYGNIYSPNPANFVYRSGFGWCNWWPEVLHPNQPDLLWGSQYRRSSVPAPGAAVFFSGGVQGASAAGHYAEVVAVNPDHYWVLVSEMNFYWRGGGWQRVDYRYIHVGPGVTFIYP